jgi:hypothetical protein
LFSFKSSAGLKNLEIRFVALEIVDDNEEVSRVVYWQHQQMLIKQKA